MQQLNLQQCKARPFSICANSAWMDAGLEADQKLIKELVDWTKMGPSRVAKEAGLAATTLTRSFNGEATTRISLPTMEKLKVRFPGFPGWSGEINQRILSEVASAGIEDPMREKFGAEPMKPIDVVGSAMGVTTFDPEQLIEMTSLDLSEVLDSVRRPISLANDSGAYAVTIVGDSMWPRFRPGRRVIVSPKAAVSIGDDVVVQLRSDGDEESHLQDRICTVLIKELVRRSASYIELRQFNPDVTFKVPVAQVAKVHRVIGEVY